MTFLYGVKLDISMTGYILLMVSFFMAFLFFVKNTLTLKITRIFSLFLIVVFTIITIVDIELYRNWGYRMDSTVFLYLKTPKESLASTSSGLIILLLLLTVFTIWGAFYTYKKWVEKPIMQFKPVNWYYAPVFIVIAAAMIIPMRGGLGIAPINQGAVFFSQQQYANHAALNGVWNFGQSVSTMNKNQNIVFMDEKKAHKLLKNSFAVTTEKPICSLINTDKPNIVIIMLESFTSAVIKPLGGLPNVTPNLNKLSDKGVLFGDFYASGDRSDKGIVSILSGYPAQPTTSIIKYINKTAKLPHLSKELKKLGYTSGFYYGGEINFANMNSYFLSGGFDNMVTLDDFSAHDLNSKWGAHDHVVFQRFFDDLNQTHEPFFRVMFSLSSHEPFDVPHSSEFNNGDEESKFLNSVHYTDSCLGDFIEKAKQTKWWNNTWIILVADHGSRLPGNIPYSSPEKFKIPMLWLGGAVVKDTIITKTASQIDIPLMIGNQIGQPFTDFSFSKDVLNNQKSFAFYAFNNGFGYYNDTMGSVWSNTSNAIIIDDSASSKWILDGKAFMQGLSTDFNTK